MAIESGGRPGPEHVERPQLPDPRVVLDRVDQGILPKALELGTPRIGEPRLVPEEVRERYSPLGREHFTEAVGLDALRAAAEAGPYREEAEGTSVVVYRKVDDVVTAVRSDAGAEGSSMVRYTQNPGDEAQRIPASEEVHVQDHPLGGPVRLFGLTLQEDAYRFSSERHGGGEARVHVSGLIQEDPEGNIKRASIDTSRHDG
jgi:hypothetical protein